MLKNLQFHQALFKRPGSQLRQWLMHNMQTVGGQYSAMRLAFIEQIPKSQNRQHGAIVILHGLFGSKSNWWSMMKNFHRALPERPVYALDLRNHGASPRARPMTYEAMASDVRQFVEDKGLTDIVLLGHSMGGKVAMTLALSQPDFISKLIVTDIAPILFPLTPELLKYLDAMQKLNDLPKGQIKTRADADEMLSSFEQDPSARQFLLTNFVLPGHGHDQSLARLKEKSHFNLPLNIFRESIQSIGDFPHDWRSMTKPQWKGKTLVVKGERSPYIKDENIPAFQAFFPGAKFVGLDAGHWVQAEKPVEFLQLVTSFTNDNFSS